MFFFSFPETYTLAKPDQYFNQFEERVVDRDNTEYDFRLRLSPRSQRLVEYKPEIDEFVPEEPKVIVVDEPAKSAAIEKIATGRANQNGRGRGSRTKTLKISKPSSMRRKCFVAKCPRSNLWRVSWVIWLFKCSP